MKTYVHTKKMGERRQHGPAVKETGSGVKTAKAQVLVLPLTVKGQVWFTLGYYG